MPLWAAWFTLALRTQIVGGGVLFLGVSVTDADSYPVLTRDQPVTRALDEVGLRPGDLLVRVGEADLRGIGMLGLLGLASRESGGNPSVPLVYERDGRRGETVVSLRAPPRSGLVPSFAFALTALWLMLRARPTPMVRSYFLAALCVAFNLIHPASSPAEVYASQMVIWPLTDAFLFPLSLRCVFRFPDGQVPQGRGHRIWPWFFSVRAMWRGAFLAGWFRLGEFGGIVTIALGLLALLAVGTYKYRLADAVGRRQMRWVVLGGYCGALPILAAAALSLLTPRLIGSLYDWSFVAVAFFPACLLIAVARFNLFDVDRLLSATASYNALVALLVGAGLVIVPRAADAASGIVGVDPSTGRIALSLLLAAVAVPAHGRLRPQIDRLFFKDRYALDHGFAELLPTLSQCADARALTQRVGAEVNRLMRPEACVVYAGAEESYEPVFVDGRAVPPAFAAGSLLIVSLQDRRKPLALDAAGRRADDTTLGPFDRAALETLQAEVVVPVRGDDSLTAFLCLGPKRSGDVYTSTDLSLLTVIAETVARELRRFDQDQVIREGREMQQSLRRYVPGAIADELVGGSELSAGERDVSVLFVDIRGYTSFSESRGAEEIFSTVNRYTETVSEIVRRHGGAVVEFNGDGMMAVFGAPRELPRKERAAVEAGREIVRAVGSMPVGDGAGGRTSLSVGVGIATGEAFVGNIQAVDRMIWTVIGNTTNLAARLQGLTRELHAALVIDVVTRERAQHAAADFEIRPNVPIRGHRVTQDVYLLLLPPDPPSREGASKGSPRARRSAIG